MTPLPPTSCNPDNYGYCPTTRSVGIHVTSVRSTNIWSTLQQNHCSRRIHDENRRQNQSRTSTNSQAARVAVGTPVDPAPPAQIRTGSITAYGSYLRYLASKRRLGCGCRILALGIHRSTNGQKRSHVIRSR